MAFMELVKERHSIRKYTDRQITREDLEMILEAGNRTGDRILHRIEWWRAATYKTEKAGTR